MKLEKKKKLRRFELLEEMETLLYPLILLCWFPSAAPLFCYTCVFPTVSPLDCIQFPVMCPSGQLCLSSRAVGEKGDFRVVLYEKSCVLPSMCGVTGVKYTMGLNFTFTNTCCDTHLCNGAVTSAAPYWTMTSLLLFTVLCV